MTRTRQKGTKMKLHERHNITLEAKWFISKAACDLDNLEQLCALYAELMFDDSSVASDEKVMRLVDVDKATSQVLCKITESSEWKCLTFGERLSVVAELLSTDAKYLIREERHGNTSTPGGLASDG